MLVKVVGRLEARVSASQDEYPMIGIFFFGDVVVRVFGAQLNAWDIGLDFGVPSGAVDEDLSFIFFAIF